MFNVQMLANTAWALAKLGHLEGQLFAVLARSTERQVSRFNPPDVTTTTWPFATVGRLDEQLVAALALAARRQASEFNPPDLANTAWPFAKVGHLDEQLFAACFDSGPAGERVRWAGFCKVSGQASACGPPSGVLTASVARPII